MLISDTSMNEDSEVFEEGNYILCGTCKQMFFISNDHQSWFLAKGLLVPTHCPTCIKMRKKQMREANEKGI